jgi:L-amino acid N-acyltransferase YncA
MTPSTATSSRLIRPLTDADLDRIIGIDRVHSGYSRRHFFEKRFATARARPNDFIHVGVSTGGVLQGFAIARIQRGEFGHEHAVAVLDALGVDEECGERGLGQALLEGLIEMSGKLGVRSLQSQVDWTHLDLMRFFNIARFRLAPRIDLERPVTELREEADEEL